MSFFGKSKKNGENRNLDKYVVDPDKFLITEEEVESNIGKIGSLKSRELEESSRSFSIQEEDKRSGEERRKIYRRSNLERRMIKRRILRNRRKFQRRSDEDRRTGIDRRLFNVFDFFGKDKKPNTAGFDSSQNSLPQDFSPNVASAEQTTIRDQSGMLLAHTYVKDLGLGETKVIEIYKKEPKQILLRLLDMQHIAIQRVSRTKYQIMPDGIRDNLLYVISEKSFSLYLGKTLTGKLYVANTEGQNNFSDSSSLDNFDKSSDEKQDGKVKITLFIGEHVEKVEDIKLLSANEVQLGNFKIEIASTKTHLLQIDREAGEPLVITGEEAEANLAEFKRNL